MFLHMGMTQENMENIDPNDTVIPTGIIKAIKETAHDRLIAFRDTNNEARTDYEITHAIALINHAHQAVFALQIDVHVGEMNIHVLIHPYATCHVLDVGVHNIHLQIANVLDH